MRETPALGLLLRLVTSAIRPRRHHGARRSGGAYKPCETNGEPPAYGFYCRHVDGLEVNHVRVGFEKTDDRAAFVCDDFPEAFHDGLKRTLRRNMEERLKQMGRYVEMLTGGETGSASRLRSQRQELTERWSELAEFLRDRMDEAGDRALAETFLEILESAVESEGKDYLSVIKSLNKQHKSDGTRWLDSIVDHAVSGAYRLIPSFA